MTPAELAGAAAYRTRHVECAVEIVEEDGRVILHHEPVCRVLGDLGGAGVVR